MSIFGIEDKKNALDLFMHSSENKRKEACGVSNSCFLESCFSFRPIKIPSIAASSTTNVDFSISEYKNNHDTSHPTTILQQTSINSSHINPHQTNMLQMNVNSFPTTILQQTSLNSNPPTLQRASSNNNPPPNTMLQQTSLNNNSSNEGSRMIQVARYGRIYKRKAPSKNLGSTKFVCPPGHRYCKICNVHLPLDAFYTTVKRYVCKRHHYLRVRSKFVKRVFSDPHALHAENAWEKLVNARFYIGYEKVCYDRTDIKEIIIHAKIPLSIYPVACPIDPQIPMRPRNVAIMSLTAYNLMVRMYVLTCSRALFIGMAQRCNLLPPNFDVGWPENPFHDPNYKRQDYDVAEILREEMARPWPPETQDQDIIAEENSNKDGPCSDAMPI